MKWGWAIVALIAAGIYGGNHYDVAGLPLLGVTAPKADTLTATFPF